MWIREVKNKNEMSRRDENHQIQVQETVAWKMVKLSLHMHVHVISFLK